MQPPLIHVELELVTNQQLSFIDASRSTRNYSLPLFLSLLSRLEISAEYQSERSQDSQTTEPLSGNTDASLTRTAANGNNNRIVIFQNLCASP